MVHPSARKGATFELECTKDLVASGIAALKVPLSGAVATYPGDVVCDWGGQQVVMQMKCGKLSGYAKALATGLKSFDSGYLLISWTQFKMILTNRAGLPCLTLMGSDGWLGEVIKGHAEAPHDALVFKQRYLKPMPDGKKKRLTSEIRVIIPPHSILNGER